jgi:hypothetical protein
LARRSTSTRTIDPRKLAVCWLAALLWPATLTLTAAGTDAPPIDPDRLRRENAELQRLLDAADGDEFYLVFDVEHSVVRLMLAGVTLQEFEARAAELSAPRVLWRERPIPADWQLLTWLNGQLDPAPDRERIELVGAADGSAPPPAVPHIATGPEPPPVEGMFRIHFDGGLALEVLYAPALPDSVEVRGPSIFTRARTAVERAWAMFRRPEEGDAVRVRVQLTTEGAATLYASLPPQSKLLFLTEATLNSAQ